MRRWLPIVLVMLAGCGGEDSADSDPHPPRTADERLLADRYPEVAEARRPGLELETEVLAVADPYYGGNEIQISAELLSGGSRLIVFFRRTTDGWRVKKVMVGGYG